MLWLNYSRFPRLNWRALFIFRIIHLKTRMLQICELFVRASPTSSFWREENRTLTEWRLHGRHGEVPRGGAASFRRRASAAAPEVLSSLFSRSRSLSPISRLPPAFRLTFGLHFCRRHQWRRIAVELEGRIDARFRHRESPLLLDSFAEVGYAWVEEMNSF
jgi:hypothetical protein